jgi:hypothetical protein
MRAQSLAGQVVGYLMPDNNLLKASQDRFSFHSLKPNLFDPFTLTINRVDRHNQRQSVGAFDERLDRDFHGGTLLAHSTPTPRVAD